MKEFNQQFSTIRLREEFDSNIKFTINDPELDRIFGNLIDQKQIKNLAPEEAEYKTLSGGDWDILQLRFEDDSIVIKKGIEFIDCAHQINEEGSATGGEAFAAGLDVPEKKYKAGYVDKIAEEKDVEPKLAAGNTKNIMKGWEDAPSIPNRPSKGGFIYKQLFEYLKENKEEFKKDDIVKYNGKDWKVIKVLRDGDMYKLEKGGTETNVSLNVLKRQQKENLKEGIKTEITKRNKSQQFNEAAKLANKKLKEVNAILEYASKLKLELHETGNAPANRLMEKIKSSVVEAYKKIKEL
jgi:predicted DNA-binding antitoxin AbrB/MazE fold protein